MDVKVNINNTIQVKLTAYGIDKWITDNNERFKGIPHLHLTVDIVMKNKLENGYWEFSFWNLMFLFGDDMFAGNPNLPFETDVIIPIELSRQNKIEKFLNDTNS